jgi:hypothetical protein
MTPTVDAYAPRVLPSSWSMAPVPSFLRGARAYDNVFGLRVLVTVEDRGPETGWWLHVSVSRATKLPSWSDLREVKDLLIGRDRCALHLIPPEAFYVNVHNFTLHLWSRLDADSVPPRLYEDR